MAINVHFNMCIHMYEAAIIAVLMSRHCWQQIAGQQQAAAAAAAAAAAECSTCGR
jgi:hypothetical protein